MTTQYNFSQSFAQFRPITNGHELAGVKTFAKTVQIFYRSSLPSLWSQPK